jgi:ribose transport system substrate-binding protein
MKFALPPVGACLLLVGLLGCTQQSSDAPAESGRPSTLTVAVIPKGTTHEFWKSINAGAFKARDELAAQGRKVDVIWKGPLREDDRDQQIQVVESFTVRRVNGIVLAPLDSQALVRPVETAAQAGIPVVIIDSDLNSDQYVSFVATDNYQGGRMAAQHLGQLLGGQGNVLLLRYAVGSASTEAREAGFLDVMTGEFPGISLLSTNQFSGATRESAYQAAQNLLNRFGRDVDGIFCPNESTTVMMTRALRDIGRAAGQVKMVGFDAGTQSVADLQAGDVQGLVVQNPFLMGYLGVLSVVNQILGDPPEKRIDTGVTLVTQENMRQPEIQELLHPPLNKYLR